MHKIKTKYLTIALIISNIIYLVIPLTSVDKASALMHDGRWWINHYYEFKATFPHVSPVSLNAFNNSGLIFNQMYPTNTLRLLETPFIILNISNPYIVIQGITILTSILTIIGIYLIAKSIKIQEPLFITFVFWTMLSMTHAYAPINSLTQNIAIALMCFGIYAIINKKYIMFGMTVYLLFNTSISSSIIAAVCFFIGLLYFKYTIKEWLLIISTSIVGLICAIPVLLPVFKTINHVTAPTILIKASKRSIFIFNSPINISTILQIACVIIPVLFIILIILSKTHVSKKLLTFITIIATIGFFPRLSSYMTTPIQEGTWPRTWPILVIFTLILFQHINVQKLKLYLIGIAILSSIANFCTLTYAQQTTNSFKTAISQKNTQDIASINQKGLFRITDKKLSTQVNQYVSTISPDYIPKKASAQDNQIVYLPESELLSKYGIKKEVINHGRTLQITINPKQNVTPLAFWHYDHIKYDIKTSNGFVNVSNHDMYEYHGLNPSIILITVD